MALPNSVVNSAIDMADKAASHALSVVGDAGGLAGDLAETPIDVSKAALVAAMLRIKTAQADLVKALNDAAAIVP